MATCSTQDLLAEASCFSCYPSQQQYLMQLVMLCRWLQTLDPMADCSPTSLLRNASCFACHTPGELALIQTQLMCEILHAGGGSGNSCLLCSGTDPVAIPDCTCALHYNKSKGAIWILDSDVPEWVQIFSLIP